MRIQVSLTERPVTIAPNCCMRVEAQGGLGIPYASLDVLRGILLRGPVLSQFFQLGDAAAWRVFGQHRLEQARRDQIGKSAVRAVECVQPRNAKPE